MQQEDSTLSRSVALDSKKLAEASTRDSSSMKAVAVLTMVFLPSTAVAVSTQALHYAGYRDKSRVRDAPPTSRLTFLATVTASDLEVDNIQHGTILVIRARLYLLGLHRILALLGDYFAAHNGGYSCVAGMAVAVSEAAKPQIEGYRRRCGEKDTLGSPINCA